MRDNQILTGLQGALASYNSASVLLYDTVKRILRDKPIRKIEVIYMPSELKSNYGYHQPGVPASGWRRLSSAWVSPPIYGRQFNPMQEEL